MPRSAPNRFATSNSTGRTTVLPASTLARSSRSFTSSDEGVGRLPDEADLALLLGLERRRRRAPRAAARERLDRVHRRAELVAHVREEARLHLVGAPQVIRLLVELRVERDDAAVRVLELAVEALELLLAAPELVERAQQLLVLALDLLEGVRAAPGGASAVRTRADVGAVRSGRAAGQELLEHDRRAAPGADSISKWSISRRAPTIPSPIPVARPVAAVEDPPEVARCPGPSSVSGPTAPAGWCSPSIAELDACRRARS